MCLHPSGQTPPPPPTAPPSPHCRERGRGATGQQLCPYSQHLTGGPDVHTGNSNNLSNISPLWDPAPAGAARYMTRRCVYCVYIYIYHVYIYRERENLKRRQKLNYSIKPNLAGLQTVQKLYCTLSISSAHQPKAIHYLAQTQFPIR